MTDNSLRLLLRDAEGEILRFVFTDRNEMLAKLVSVTHVDADDTVVLLRVGAPPEECGWQVQLADIRSVAAVDGRCLYQHP